MKLSIREKKVLYAFGCPNYQNTVTRMKWLTALTVDPEASAGCWNLPGSWKWKPMKAGTTAFIIICGLRWMSITGQNAVCV